MDAASNRAERCQLRVVGDSQLRVEAAEALTARGTSRLNSGTMSKTDAAGA